MATKTEDIPPNQTIYINNLNEKVKKEELKKSLYALFSQFGPILDVVAMKTLKMRGQAFIVFKDIVSASNAIRQMQGFKSYDKPMKIQYSKSKSDIVARMDGTYVPKEKRKKQQEKKRKAEAVEADSITTMAKRQEREKAKPLEPSSMEESAAAGQVPAVKIQPPSNPPNNILFIQNLPEECTELMLQMLFRQFPGYKETRLVPGKKGLAFVEFDNEMQASVAMSGLQHFKITPDHHMVISYAKK